MGWLQSLFRRKPQMPVIPGRFQLRDGRLMARSFDSAHTSIENQNHWAQADSKSPNASTDSWTRRVLRNRSRYETKNNSYLRGMVQTKANYVVGRGPRLQMLTGDKERDKQIEADWKRWVYETDFNRKLRVMYFAEIQDGEGCGLYVPNNRLSPNLPPLDVRPLETDYFSDPYDPVGRGDEDEVDGMRLDRQQNVRSVHVLRYHPGSSNSYFGATEGDWRPYDRVIHLYREDRPGQRRGIPHTTPALPLFAILRRYTLASLGTAENAANMALFLKTDASLAAEELQEIDEFLTFPFVRNMLTSLPFGWDVNQLKAEQPTDQFVDFHDKVLSEAARCLDMPFNVASANSSAYNMASGRLDYQVFHKAIEIERADMGRQAVEKTFELWLRMYLSMQSGIAMSDIDMTLYRHRWGWDDVIHADPEKIMRSEIGYWEKALLSDQMFCASHNIDPEELYEQLEDQQKRRGEIGAPLPGTFQQRVVGRGGGAGQQNAEQQEPAGVSNEA